MFLFIPGSGIGVLIFGPPLPCMSKALLIVFLVLLDCILFLNCPGVNIHSVVNKIGRAASFLFQPCVCYFDCARFVILFYTAHLVSMTGVPIRFRFIPVSTAFGVVSSLASTCSPLSI